LITDMHRRPLSLSLSSILLICIPHVIASSSASTLRRLRPSTSMKYCKSAFRRRCDPKCIDNVVVKAYPGWLDSIFGGGNREQEPQTQIQLGVDDENFEYVPLPVPEWLLQGTPLMGRQLARCYQATKHGWDARAFHDRCDMKGPSFVVAKTKKGRLVGGFMPLEWKSSNDYRETNTDFLFYAENSNSEPVRIEKRDFSPVYDYRRGGPQWGSEALIIGEPIGAVMGVFTGPDPRDTGIGDLRTAKSRLGLSHSKGKDGETSLFGSEGNEVQLVELEIFVSPEIALMY